MFRSPEKIAAQDKSCGQKVDVLKENIKVDEDPTEMVDGIFKEVTELIREGKFSRILDYSQRLLVLHGVVEAEALDHNDPVVAIALAEAVNLAAKSIDYRFYDIKPAVVVSAWKSGARFGYNSSDGTYSLFHPAIGTASFHDPGNEIRNLVANVLEEEIPAWEHEWSGIYRQGQAFDILRDLKAMEGLIAELIRTTTPEPLEGEGIDFTQSIHGGRKDTLLERYGKESLQVKLHDIVLASEDVQVRALLQRLHADGEGQASKRSN
jgi:hypothetical protein